MKGGNQAVRFKHCQLNSQSASIPVATWGFALRGKRSVIKTWFSWTLKARIYAEVWKILYSAGDEYIGNITKLNTLKISVG